MKLVSVEMTVIWIVCKTELFSSKD
uniref:Uncharacterized protein n=1 Tax=Rhizophora mucronata TaxID=61149 RepID=A0A2P2QY58_RHIMU